MSDGLAGAGAGYRSPRVSSKRGPCQVENNKMEKERKGAYRTTCESCFRANIKVVHTIQGCRGSAQSLDTDRSKDLSIFVLSCVLEVEFKPKNEIIASESRAPAHGKQVHYWKQVHFLLLWPRFLEISEAGSPASGRVARKLEHDRRTRSNTGVSLRTRKGGN
jgi:hypothetical protein